MSFTDVTIKIPDRGCDQGWEWRHVLEAWAEIWEKSVSWVLPWEKTVDFRKLAEALCQVCTWFGVDGKVSIERWYLSPYVKIPFNSKVIKSFVPELISRVFRVSGFQCSMNILWTFHIFISGYVTIIPFKLCFCAVDNLFGKLCTLCQLQIFKFLCKKKKNSKKIRKTSETK